jgi:hypothetical protein
MSNYCAMFAPFQGAEHRAIFWLRRLPDDWRLKCLVPACGGGQPAGIRRYDYVM